MQESFSYDWLWFGPLRGEFLDLPERDRQSIMDDVARVCRDPWPDWQTKDWAEEDDEGRLLGRLIVYQGDEWILVYEVPQPLVVVIFSFDRL